jgi:hypothetical protein
LLLLRWTFNALGTSSMVRGQPEECSRCFGIASCQEQTH